MERLRVLGRRAASALTIAAAGLLFAPGAAIATDFRSIAEGGAVMYDGPSLRAQRVYVASRGLPVELISTDGTWVKVRDAAGDLAWVEGKVLSERRTVVVIVPIADVRQAASEQSALVFQAGQGVALDLADQAGTTPGWVRIRHRDGTGGFVHIREIWGV